MARIHGRTIFKKGLNDPNSYSDVITHLKTDILELAEMTGCMVRYTGKSVCLFCGEQPPSKGPGFMATLSYLVSTEQGRIFSL